MGRCELTMIFTRIYNAFYGSKKTEVSVAILSVFFDCFVFCGRLDLDLDCFVGLLPISTSVTICDCFWRKFQCEHKILPVLVQTTFKAVY